MVFTDAMLDFYGKQYELRCAFLSYRAFGEDKRRDLELRGMGRWGLGVWC
jgi:hypothetical protein